MTWYGTKRHVLTAVAVGFLSLSAVACGGNRAEREEAVDTLSQRQRDSLLGTMPVPAGGLVEDALKAADQALERAEQHDTIAQPDTIGN